MIGLVLVTHGRLAEQFVTAMEHVVGKQERVATICIEADDDMESRRGDIAEAITSIRPASISEIARLEGVPPNRS
ncbi:MAG: hypothetical protein EOO22_26150, partial [Comamonadaceae bacterium]